MKNRRNFSIYSYLLMGVLFVFASSCEKDDDEEKEPVAALSENAVVIDETDWENSFISYDTVNNTFNFNDNIEDMNLEIGDIIVSDSDEGILRKVSEISNEEGTIIVQTDNADLEDVIENGEFVIEQPLTVSDLKSVDYHYEGISLKPSSLKKLDNTNFSWNVNTVIYDEDGIANGIGDQIRLVGEFSCSWDIYMNVKISWFKLKKVRVGFEASENLDLELIASLGYDFEESVNLMTVKFKNITVYIAGCPVVVTPVLEINAGIEGSAEAKITTSISQSLSFDAGIEYIKGSGWSPYKSFIPEFECNPPQLEVNAAAKVYLGPELTVKIYGVKGPYIATKIYGRLEADLFATPWWTFYGGLELSAGARVEKFGKTLFDIDYPKLIIHEEEIAHSTIPAPEMPTVSTTSITNITATSASGGGIITDEGSSSVTICGVCWSDAEEGQTPTIDDNKTEDGPGAGSFESSISGLTASTTYSVRAYATNSSGTGYGSVINFTTESIPVLSTSPITDITKTTALSGGNITSDGGGTVTARGVCWIDAETGQTPTIDDNKTEDGPGAGTFVSSISGLTANITYSVRAYATNSAGTGYGSVINFTTESIPVLSILSTSPITDITKTTALSGGNITSDGGATVTARGVCWSAGAIPTISDNITTDGTGDGSFESSINGLTANTTYYVRAYATNSAGTGYGNDLSFTTEGGSIVVTLDNVNPDIEANQTWTESGVVLSLQEYSGQTAFGIQTDGIWLWPCLLHADLSGLQGTITEVEVDINDGCGENCTEVKLFDGDVEIAQAGNTSIGLHTLLLSDYGGDIPDVLTVTSSEGQVLEIRITLQPN